ncbi:hypothetical protein JCM10213v2_008777 [Rhodosporidiobolus nylandii]
MLLGLSSRSGSSPPSTRPNPPAVSSSSSSSALCSCGGKRDASAPTANPHLPSPERLKKRKLRHSFFRSEALFSPPTSPSARQRSKTPSTSAWWPSVSRNYGDGAQSRFAPREEEWTGDEGGWVAQLAGVFSTVSLGVSPASPPPPAPAPVRPPPPPRSFSSPASLGPRPPSFSPPPEAPAPEEAPLEGPALKQLLLRNLRARLAAEGGTSTGAAAALRFKKWVVYNSFCRRQLEHEGAHLSSPEVETEMEPREGDEPDSSFSNGTAFAPQDGDFGMSFDDGGGPYGFAGDEEDELPTPPFEVGLGIGEEEDPPALRRTTSLPTHLTSSSLSYDSSPSASSFSSPGGGAGGGWTLAGGSIVACEG